MTTKNVFELAIDRLKSVPHHEFFSYQDLMRIPLIAQDELFYGMNSPELSFSKNLNPDMLYIVNSTPFFLTEEELSTVKYSYIIQLTRIAKKEGLYFDRLMDQYVFGVPKNFFDKEYISKFENPFEDTPVGV